MWVSLKLVFSFTQRVKYLGKVNLLDSTKRAGAAFQPSPSFQSSSQSESESESESSPSLSILAGRKREGNYKLTSTSSLSVSNPTHANPPLVVQTLQRQQAASSNPPGVGYYVLSYHWEWGERDLRRKSASLENWDFLATSTVQYCLVGHWWPQWAGHPGQYSTYSTTVLYNIDVGGR
jgi:hypothetical protein